LRIWIQADKNDPKKVNKILLFEVLDVLFEGLKASSVAIRSGFKEYGSAIQVKKKRTGEELILFM
jgi:hypothetical protein